MYKICQYLRICTCNRQTRLSLLCKLVNTGIFNSEKNHIFCHLSFLLPDSLRDKLYLLSRHQMEKHVLLALLCGEFTGHRWIPLIKGQWRRALMFWLICAWTNRWVSNRSAGDLRRRHTHYDIIIMWWGWMVSVIIILICWKFALCQSGWQIYHRANSPIAKLSGTRLPSKHFISAMTWTKSYMISIRILGTHFSTYMRQWIGSILAQILACLLKTNFSEFFCQNKKKSHSRKCIWIYRLPNAGYFVRGMGVS